MINRHDYEKYINWLAGIAAVVVILVSVYFSAKGFGITMGSHIWVGYLFGFLITVCQILFNNTDWDRRHSFEMGTWLLVIVGIVSYIYGIGTNLAGFLFLQNRTISQAMGDIPSLLIPLSAAVIIEILPEVMLKRALLGAPGKSFSTQFNIPDFRQPPAQEPKLDIPRNTTRPTPTFRPHRR